MNVLSEFSYMASIWNGCRVRGWGCEGSVNDGGTRRRREEDQAVVWGGNQAFMCEHSKLNR